MKGFRFLRLSGDFALADEHVPELVLSGSIRSALNRLGILAWCVLFSILYDPEPDEDYKHYFPSLLDTIVFSDGEWLVSYKLLDNGDVQVDFIIRDSDAL